MTYFSIIIPCFNAEDTLEATLKSIKTQTYDDWEIICVEDGSSDDTMKLLRRASAADTRIRLIRNIGKGPSQARNLGAMSYAQGDVIAFCDADDIWGPQKLAQLHASLSDPSIDAVFGKVAFFTEDPSQAKVFSTVPSGDLTISMLLGENPVCTMSNIAVRKTTFVQSLGFDEEMVHNEDLDWLIRMVGSGARVVGVDETQTWYRASPKGLSADLYAMQQGRATAVRTAARYNYIPTASSEAIFLRYLSRRALRLGHARLLPLKFALQGVVRSPIGFFRSPKRGLGTLIGASLMPLLPARLAQSLFSR